LERSTAGIATTPSIVETKFANRHSSGRTRSPP
jgi:hypothetical protein